MKLELKHLAPYLPYGLKYFDKDTNELTVMRSISYEINLIDMGWGNAHCLNEFKPILRPLSDFNKNLYSEIFKTFNLNWQNSEDFCLTPVSVNSVSYELVNILIKIHFDVFGLIEKGLAIDINTIN